MYVCMQACYSYVAALVIHSEILTYMCTCTCNWSVVQKLVLNTYILLVSLSTVYMDMNIHISSIWNFDMQCVLNVVIAEPRVIRVLSVMTLSPRKCCMYSLDEGAASCTYRHSPDLFRTQLINPKISFREALVLAYSLSRREQEWC